MKYRRLGRTGVRVPVVGVGTWQLGGDWGKDFTQAEADAMLGRAAEIGINLIDTAACYGPDHLSESMIGRFLRGRDRDDWVIASKFGHRPGWQPDELRQTLDDSLRALGTDYIDVWQFHSGSDEQFRTEGMWEELNRQVESGKVRHLGISIGPNTNIYQTSRATEVNASTIQVVYNRLDRGAEEQVLPSCEEQDLGVLARVPLASGLLSGKYGPDAKWPERDVRARRDPGGVRARIEQVLRIRDEEVPEGVQMAPWALAWCLQHPAVTCVIPGCKTVGQVESNASAADLDMVRDDHPQAWPG